MLEPIFLGNPKGVLFHESIPEVTMNTIPRKFVLTYLPPLPKLFLLRFMAYQRELTLSMWMGFKVLLLWISITYLQLILFLNLDKLGF